MSLFRKGNVVTENADFEINFDEIEERDFGFNEGFMLMAENEANYNAIMKAIGIHEVNYLEDNGSEIVYEAVDVKGFINKIIEFFKGVLSRIAGMFKSFISLIDRIAATDKEFINKYRTLTNKMNSKTKSQFTFQGYEFNSDLDNLGKTKINALWTAGTTVDVEAEVTKMKGKSTQDADSALKTLEEKIEDKDDEIRGKVIDGKPVSMDEFSKELREMLYGDDKVELDNIDVSKHFKIIEDTKKVKKDAEDIYKVFDKEVKAIIKKYEKIEGKILKLKEDDMSDKSTDGNVVNRAYRTVNIVTKEYKTTSSVGTAFYSAWLKAVKDRNAQSRVIITRMVAFRPKNEGVDHFVDDEGSSRTSYLENVVLK